MNRPPYFPAVKCPGKSHLFYLCLSACLALTFSSVHLCDTHVSVYVQGVCPPKMYTWFNS